MSLSKSQSMAVDRLKNAVLAMRTARAEVSAMCAGDYASECVGIEPAMREVERDLLGAMARISGAFDAQ